MLSQQADQSGSVTEAPVAQARTQMLIEGVAGRLGSVKLAFLVGHGLRAFGVAGGVVTCVFLMLHLIPGDPAVLIAGPYADRVTIASLHRQLGLSLPLWTQFGHYVTGLIHGDWGHSFLSGEGVLQLLWPRYLATLELALGAGIIAIAGGLLGGVLAAARQGTSLDRLFVFVAVLALAVPSFVFGILLILVVSVWARWLSAAGQGGMVHLILPAVTLSAWSLGVVMRQARGSMLDVLHQDYIRTAAAKGVDRFNILVRHALRNAALPITAIAGLNFGYMLGGAVVVESIFGWPGLGSFMVSSVLSRDFPSVQGSILMFALNIITVNTLVDLSVHYLDPRVRLE